MEGSLPSAELAHLVPVSFQDAIGFEGVDIITPSRGGQPGVTLVKGLKFRLEVGDSLLLVGASKTRAQATAGLL